MRVILPFLFSFLFFSFQANAQLEKTIHQTFPLENRQTVTLDIYGDYELIPWAGDHILTESNIKLYDASEGILEHFLKIGRYDMHIDSSSGSFILVSNDKERRSVKTKNGDAYEFVKIKVFVPDAYAIIDETTLALKSSPETTPIPDEGGR
jgi:hypothetical protein